MRNGCARRNTLGHVPSQLHTALRRTRRAFTLAELLVALAVTALIISLGVGTISQWSTGTHTLPVLAARQASDAQVQQMIGELRSAIAISSISANEVVATVDTNGASGLTPSVNGTPTGPYQVAYYFGSATGALYRNGGPSASLGSPQAYNPSLPTSGLPAVPAAPGVNPPGAQPTKPTCASPCYNPSGAYVQYTAYYWSGGTAYSSTNSSGANQSSGIGGTTQYGWGVSTGCGMYRALGGGNGYNQPMGAKSYNLSGSQARQATESYLGTQTYYCDWTRNGPMGTGSYVAVRYDRYGTLTYNCYGTGMGTRCSSWTGYVTAIFYAPWTSKTSYYYLPSCGCVLSQSGYTADVNHWNNYQSQGATYQQQLAAWNGAKTQWGAYGRNYGTYAGSMTGWNATNASSLANLANQSPSTSVALTSSGWPATSTWWTVANHLSAVTFTGYDQNMNVTSTASAIRTLGITVQYPGQPAEQEQLTLAGTTQYTATVTRPLVIPPDPPDPRTCNGCAVGANTVYGRWSFGAGRIGEGGAGTGQDTGQDTAGCGGCGDPPDATDQSGVSDGTGLDNGANDGGIGAD